MAHIDRMIVASPLRDRIDKINSIKNLDDYQLGIKIIELFGKDRIDTTRSLLKTIESKRALTKLYREAAIGIDTLLSDKGWHIRWSIVENPSCPDRLLRNAILDQSPIVRQAARDELVKRFKNESRKIQEEIRF